MKVWLPVLSALLLAACGGASSWDVPYDDGGPGTLAEVLFQDDFDEPLSPDRWTLPAKAVEMSPVPSSLALRDEQATTSHAAFLRGEEPLEFVIEMSWPCDCPEGGHLRGLPIQIVERDSDIVLASILIDIDDTVGQATVMYRIDPTGRVSPSSVVGVEVLDLEAFVDAFHTYRIEIWAAGYAQWSRNGRTFITSFTPLADHDLVLRLGGREGDGDPVLYDYVTVGRPGS